MRSGGIAAIASQGRVIGRNAKILSHTLLKEVGLPLQGDHLHPVEGIGRVVDLAVPFAAEGQHVKQGASDTSPP